jgi:hypothetical protein
MHTAFVLNNYPFLIAKTIAKPANNQIVATTPLANNPIIFSSLKTNKKQATRPAKNKGWKI